MERMAKSTRSVKATLEVSHISIWPQTSPFFLIFLQSSSVVVAEFFLVFFFFSLVVRVSRWSACFLSWLHLGSAAGKRTGAKVCGRRIASQLSVVIVVDRSLGCLVAFTFCERNVCDQRGHPSFDVLLVHIMSCHTLLLVHDRVSWPCRVQIHLAMLFGALLHIRYALSLCLDWLLSRSYRSLDMSVAFCACM